MAMAMVMSEQADNQSTDDPLTNQRATRTRTRCKVFVWNLFQTSLNRDDRPATVFFLPIRSLSPSFSSQLAT